MGRRKLDMELIANERSRILSFKKRKEGLMKKLHELTTLCDVSACMIIYGPLQQNRVVAPEIWPHNPDEVRRVIDVYRSKSRDSGTIKSSGLSDFFHERERKAEEELARLRRENAEAKYPTWGEFLNFLNVAELRAFAAALNDKAQVVRSRIEFLKREKQELDMLNEMMAVDFAPQDFSQFYNLDQELNYNMHCVSIEGQEFYDQAAAASAAGDGLGDPTICYDHTMPLPETCHAPLVLQPVVSPPSHTHWPMILEGVAPPAELDFSSNENLDYHDDGGGVDDIIQYLMRFTAAGGGDELGDPTICYDHSMAFPETYHAPPVLQPVPPPSDINSPMFSGEVAPPAQMHFSSDESLNYQDGGGDDDFIQYLLQMN